MNCKVFEQAPASIKYCVAKMHVHATGQFREVLPCDNSCKTKPVLRRAQISRETVEYLRSHIGGRSRIASR